MKGETMQNAIILNPAIRIQTGFLSLIHFSARLAGAIGIERRSLHRRKAVPACVKWAAKNDAVFESADPQAIACKPISAWRMILQENKIRK
jgi:hypothetical protein